VQKIPAFANTQAVSPTHLCTKKALKPRLHLAFRVFTFRGQFAEKMPLQSGLVWAEEILMFPNNVETMQNQEL
jgi:hypothetical protein